ncbi:hypothetical protein QO000_001172 [Alkalihalobacillus hemicentroti]|uniref:Uncharacterized protein n=1 Tax=Guptibacillus hwajinpoensis TaxID=208199 RepID=A0ABU0JYQ8_9BACL|nr:hypothetical protein [Alkalihalobacillus hemicentroti]
MQKSGIAEIPLFLFSSSPDPMDLTGLLSLFLSSYSSPDPMDLTGLLSLFLSSYSSPDPPAVSLYRLRQKASHSIELQHPADLDGLLMLFFQEWKALRLSGVIWP